MSSFIALLAYNNTFGYDEGDIIEVRPDPCKTGNLEHIGVTAGEGNPLLLARVTGKTFAEGKQYENASLVSGTDIYGKPKTIKVYDKKYKIDLKKHFTPEEKKKVEDAKDYYFPEFDYSKIEDKG